MATAAASSQTVQVPPNGPGLLALCSTDTWAVKSDNPKSISAQGPGHSCWALRLILPISITAQHDIFSGGYLHRRQELMFDLLGKLCTQTFEKNNTKAYCIHHVCMHMFPTAPKLINFGCQHHTGRVTFTIHTWGLGWGDLPLVTSSIATLILYIYGILAHAL